MFRIDVCKGLPLCIIILQILFSSGKLALENAEGYPETLTISASSNSTISEEMANRLGMYKMTKVTRNGRPEWEQQKSNLTGNTLAKSKTNSLYFDCNGYWFIWPEEKKDLGGFQLRQKGKLLFSFEHPYSYDKHLPQAKLGSLLALLLGSIGKEGRPMSWSSQSRFSFQKKKLNLCSSTIINIQVVEGSCESKKCPSQQTCHDLWGGVACYTYWVPFPFGCFINNAKHFGETA